MMLLRTDRELLAARRSDSFGMASGLAALALLYALVVLLLAWMDPRLSRTVLLHRQHEVQGAVA